MTRPEKWKLNQHSVAFNSRWTLQGTYDVAMIMALLAWN